ncbi:MAG: hypothetical protein ACPIOQ_78555 [Promethearchaeia archaeon]
MVASIPACQLVASGFREIMKVHVDQYGHIRGVWYQTMATGAFSENLQDHQGVLISTEMSDRVQSAPRASWWCLQDHSSSSPV